MVRPGGDHPQGARRDCEYEALQPPARPGSSDNMTLEAETESMAAEPLASSTAAVEVPPPPFGASSKLTQEIYSAFVQAFPDLFADPKPVAEKDNEENDEGGAEGENEGNGSPNKAEASPAKSCLLYTSPSPRDPKTSRMPSSA